MTELLVGLGVTTARAEREGQRIVAHHLAAELGVPFVERRGLGAERLMDEQQLLALIVVNEERIHYQARDGARFFWHPNMAFVRLHSAERSGQADPLARAGQLGPGDRVLDATLGLAADAIVASWSVGEAGQVIGLEASPVIAALVRHGLATYRHRLESCLRRILVRTGNHNDGWSDEQVMAGGFDVIYFDPMFEETVTSSSEIDGVRRLACYDRLTPETLSQARAFARRAVVVKGRGNDPWLADLRPDRWVQGRHRRVAYAVFETSAGE